MYVEHFPCDPAVNASEELACAEIQRFLRSCPGDCHFALLTNLAYSINSNALPDEIDLVVVGSTGVMVVEIKHWDRTFIKRNAYDAELAADRIALKAKRIAGRVRSIVPHVFVKPKILLTKETKSLQNFDGSPIQGVEIHALSDLDALLEMHLLNFVTDADVTRLSRILAPRSAAALTTPPRRIGQITDLALLSSPEERFHRVYKGRNAVTQDRLIVHVFDLSASDAPNAEQRARREFEVVQKLQKSPWLPSLVDSYQPLPGYAGELFFYSLVDSEAPTLQERAKDATWDLNGRIRFAAQTLDALAELHGPQGDDPPVIHRMLSPTLIRVRKSESPLFAGWHWAKMPVAQTISGPPHPDFDLIFVSPEVGAVACTRFRRHRVRCFDGAGGGLWRDGSSRGNSSLRPCA